VCDTHRINRHKVFAGLAQRGKTSMGWFFGFKLASSSWRWVGLPEGRGSGMRLA
jgi:hypothetical protein